MQIPLREIASQMRKNAQIFAFVSTKYCGFLRFFALTQAILIARKFAIHAIQIAQKAFFLRNFACESIETFVTCSFRFPAYMHDI